MTADRWHGMTAIFHAALACDPAVRDGFLSDACKDDPSFRHEVDALVAAHLDAASFGQDPLFPAGDRVSRRDPTGGLSIDALLGVGGMGEVYRAHDTEFGRRSLSGPAGRRRADPDRRARLDTEARLLAALNHPHIAAIFGIAEADAVRALVLELVEGETLADRLIEGPLRPMEALRVAKQIADALDATHEKGIVHRDLKPANIKITSTGVVKVLDFGLAKVQHGEHALTGDLAWSDTDGQSREGLIVGTVAYMSPEQARGQLVD